MDMYMLIQKFICSIKVLYMNQLKMLFSSSENIHGIQMHTNFISDAGNNYQHSNICCIRYI